MQGNEGLQGAREGASFQGATLNAPQEELLLNVAHAHPGSNLQGAKLNVPQEEMPLNMDPRGEGAGQSKTLGFRVVSFDRQCGGVM